LHDEEKKNPKIKQLLTLSPARYDQIVVVGTEVVDLKRASIKFSYLIWDEGQEKILVEGESVHACINRQGKVVRIPSEVSSKIN
ncbi:MAG: hypothetical protein L7F78_06865, partial [Syntrophales bacterium LBB04]|nr:hypothetical protein [Syntrophales bacterium LBB04]